MSCNRLQKQFKTLTKVVCQGTKLNDLKGDMEIQNYTIITH